MTDTPATDRRLGISSAATIYLRSTSKTIATGAIPPPSRLRKTLTSISVFPLTLHTRAPAPALVIQPSHKGHVTVTSVKRDCQTPQLGLPPLARALGTYFGEIL
jgi:hypothetical protein